jgi:hypothetical protein
MSIPTAQDDAPAWRPEPGDQLAGTITDLAVIDRGHGPYPCVTIRRQDGSSAAWHAFHDVARAELAKIAPQVGDPLAVTYQGKHPERGYHRWRVHGDAAPFDWQRFGDAPAPTALPAPTPAAPAPAAPAPDDDLPF